MQFAEPYENTMLSNMVFICIMQVFWLQFETGKDFILVVLIIFI